MADGKLKIADIEGGCEMYENTLLIGGRWKDIPTACCGVCGKPLAGKNKRHISADTYYGYVFKCECGHEVELRILEVGK